MRSYGCIYVMRTLIRWNASRLQPCWTKAPRVLARPASRALFYSLHLPDSSSRSGCHDAGKHGRCVVHAESGDAQVRLSTRDEELTFDMHVWLGGSRGRWSCRHQKSRSRALRYPARKTNFVTRFPARRHSWMLDAIISATTAAAFAALDRPSTAAASMYASRAWVRCPTPG
jgi:hypothetical protein